MSVEQFHTLTLYCLTALFGLCVGSFLNVVIYRVPRKMSLSSPPSHCTSCGYRLRPLDNIPLLSYIFLGGKCRRCRTRISLRYPTVELLNAALWLISVRLFFDENPVYAVASAIVSSCLIAVFFIDIDCMLIFDRFNVIILACGIAVTFVDVYAGIADHLVGAAVGAAVFAALHYGSRQHLGREGLGFGDVKLAAVSGLLLGWQRFILAMLIASLSACAVMLPRLFVRKESGEFPFAPFISAGVVSAMLFGDRIITWYVSLLIG